MFSITNDKATNHAASWCITAITAAHALFVDSRLFLISELWSAVADSPSSLKESSAKLSNYETLGAF